MQASRSALRHLLGRGAFPARYAWFLEGFWRRWVLSPETLAGRLSLTPETVALEIGVGGGYYSRALAGGVHRMVGLDFQREMLLRTRRKSTAANLSLVQGDATTLPFADASIDLVLMITVLGEVPAPATTLADVARVLRPSGVLSVSEHVPDPDYQPFRRVRAWCEKLGLESTGRFGTAWSYTANFSKRR